MYVRVSIQGRRMRFEWDEVKNARNIQKHGIDFGDAAEVFEHPHLIAVDERFDYGEERWIQIRLMRQLFGVVVYVERDENTIRIISSRNATRREKRKYEQTIQN